MKQNLANLVILPPKNGGLKAWSHSVRKANCCQHGHGGQQLKTLLPKSMVNCAFGGQKASQC